MEDVDKFIEGYFRNIFSRAFSRKLPFIFLGLDSLFDDVFVLCSVTDGKFEYCESLQATGMVKVYNRDHLAELKTWFASFGIDGSKPYVFNFNEVLTLLNRTSWKASDRLVTMALDGTVYLTIDEMLWKKNNTGEDGENPITMEPTRIVAARPVTTYYTLSILERNAVHYHSVFFDKTTLSCVITPPDIDKVSKITTIPFPVEDLLANKIVDCLCQPINLVLIPGLDVLTLKNVVSKDVPYETGIRTWIIGGDRCLNYGGFYTTKDVALCITRDNTFIFLNPL